MKQIQKSRHNIPAIKIRNIEAEIKDLSYEIIPDKIIIHGVLHKQIFYVGIDNVIHHLGEDVSFCLFLDVVGAIPDMNAWIDIDIEKIKAHIEDEGKEIVQIVIMEIDVMISESRVLVVENSKQILLESSISIIPDKEVCVEYETIVRSKEFINSQQAIVDSILDLGNSVEKIVVITGEVDDVSACKINDKLVMVKGNIVKDITYVVDNIVYHKEEVVPFSINVNLQEPIDDGDLIPVVFIENISYRLLKGCDRVKQLIVLKANIGTENVEFINVVTSINGSGITTNTIEVEEEVLISDDNLTTEKKVFPVVTEVSDPEGLLSTIDKEIIVLNVIGSGKIPVEVVVFVSTAF